MDNFLRIFIGVGGATVTYLFGGWSTLLQILLVFIIVDYLTGLLAAWYEAKLNSKVGFRGIGKKIMILVLVAVAHSLDKVLGGNSFVQDAVIFFYLANELLSILENAGKTGLPIPSALTKAVAVLNQKSEKGDGK